MKSLIENLHICVDFSEGEDQDVLLVGKRNLEGHVDIVNVLLGDDAHEVYKKLITPNKERRSK